MFKFAAAPFHDVLHELQHLAGFSNTAIIAMVLGIVTSTAIFTLAHSALFRWLPGKIPGRLNRIRSSVDYCTPNNESYSDFFMEARCTLRNKLLESSCATLWARRALLPAFAGLSQQR